MTYTKGTSECKQLAAQRQLAFYIAKAVDSLDYSADSNDRTSNIYKLLIYCAVIPAILIPLLAWSLKTRCGRKRCWKSKKQKKLKKVKKQAS